MVVRRGPLSKFPFRYHKTLKQLFDAQQTSRDWKWKQSQLKGSTMRIALSDLPRLHVEKVPGEEGVIFVVMTEERYSVGVFRTEETATLLAVAPALIQFLSTMNAPTGGGTPYRHPCAVDVDTLFKRLGIEIVRD